MSPEIQTFLLAMTPIGELRLAIPIAITVYKLNWVLAYFVSVIGNLVPVLLLLLFLSPLSEWLSKKSPVFHKLFSWLFQRSRRRFNGKMEKYGYPMLALFVAIPLPITGGWTGAIVAFLFGIPNKKAFPLITLGVAIAGGIVLVATKAGIVVEQYLGWQILVGIILAGGLIWIMYNKIRKRLNNKIKVKQDAK